MMDHQQQHPQQFGQDGRPLQPLQPAAQSPWPGQQRPLQAFSADVRAHDPRQPQVPAQPHAQYAYAPQQGGFVQPGQPRQLPQLGVQDGVIGQPQPYGYGGGQQVDPGAYGQPGASAGFTSPFAQPGTTQHPHPQAQRQQHQQQYAFATPQGIQIVATNGSAAHAIQYGQQVQHAQQYAHPHAQQYAHPHAQQYTHPHAQLHAHPHAAANVAQVPPMPMRRSRMRWEVIVPLAAVFCLLVAIGVFAINFNEITGRGSTAKGASSTSEKQVGGTTTTDTGTGDAVATEAEARRLMRLGHYEEARVELAPLLAAGSPTPGLVQLGKVIEARGARNDALLARLGAQRSSGRYVQALATIALIERLHPLSPSLQQMRTQLLSKQRGKARGSMAETAFDTATRQLAAGRYARALATVDTALKTVPGNRRLKQLRAYILQRRAAAAQAARAPASGGGAPRAGGDTGSSGSSPAPPTTSPSNPGGMPPVPDAPNTGGGGSDVNGGQPGTTGDDMANMPGM